MTDAAAAFAPLAAALANYAAELKAAPRVWVGLSGGADSTALLIALQRLGHTKQLRATHINHGVQAQSADWVKHCQQLCARLQVPLEVFVAKAPANRRFAGGFEAWARSSRYGHWQQLLGAGDLLLLGHHANDQRETVALRLLQGRLPLPMPATRPLGTGRLLRPLLAVDRQALRGALRAHNERWLEDPSNSDPAMLRNRVRGELLPALSPGWAEALSRCGTWTGRLVHALATQIPRQSSTHNATGELMRLPLGSTGPTALQAALRLCDTAASAQQSTELLMRLRAQVQRGSATRSQPGIPLAGGKTDTANAISLWLDRSDLLIWRAPEFTPLTLVVPAARPLVARFPHGTLTITAAKPTKIVIQPPRAGDTLARAGHTHQVREELRAAGVARWARASYPLLRSPGSGAVLHIPSPEASPNPGANLSAHWEAAR